MKKKRVVIAGGGTGGHIYPALSIAQALEKIDSNTVVTFVGSKYGLESKIIPKTKYPIHYIFIRRLNKNVSLLERLTTLLFLPFTFFQTLFLYIKLRPSVVLGVGGYVSAPFVFISTLLRCPTVVWEPNAYPGLANRWLAPYVDAALVVFEEAKKLLKAKSFEIVGVPIRKEIEDLYESKSKINASKNETTSKSQDKLNVLIFGGSQGARGINNVVVESLKDNEDWQNNFNFIHQVGKTDFQKIDKLYKSSEAKFDSYFEFIDDMHNKYNWADVVVCRSGASTIAELMAVGVPSLLVPFPLSSDNHQFKNALALKSANAALLIEQKDFNESSFQKALMELKEDKALRESLGKNVKNFFIPHSSRKIAIFLLSKMRK